MSFGLRDLLQLNLSGFLLVLHFISINHIHPPASEKRVHFLFFFALLPFNPSDLTNLLTARLSQGLERVNQITGHRRSLQKTPSLQEAHIKVNYNSSPCHLGEGGNRQGPGLFLLLWHMDRSWWSIDSTVSTCVLERPRQLYYNPHIQGFMLSDSFTGFLRSICQGVFFPSSKIFLKTLISHVKLSSQIFVLVSY